MAKIYKKFALVLISIGIAICSCSKGTENSKIAEDKVSLNINNTEISDVRSLGVIDNDFMKSSFISINLDKPDINIVHDYISKICDHKFEDIYKIVLYSNLNTSEFLKGINEKNITGISIFTRHHNDELNHSFYENNGDGFSIETSLSASVLGVNLRQLERLRVLTSSGNSFVIVSDAKEEDEYFVGHDELALKEALWTNNRNATLTNQAYKTDKAYKDPYLLDLQSCAPVEGCEFGGYPECHPHGQFGYKCAKSQNCWAREVEKHDFSLEGQVSIYKTLRDSFLNQNLYHQFRDKLLINNNFGKKYVNYYYLISTYINKDLDYKLTLYTLEMLPRINSALQKIISSPEEGQIVIDNDFKDDLIALINNYKTHYNSDDLNSILEDVKADIHKVTNKSVTEIVTLFKSN